MTHTSIKGLDDVLEATEMQDNVVELQWEIKMMLIVEEEPKSYGEKWAKYHIYFMVQAQEEGDWGPQAQGN